MNSHELVKVEFYGQEIDAVYDGKKVLVGVSRVCDNLGIDGRSQRKKLQEHPTFTKGVMHITLPSTGGMQETFCLELDFFPLWLATIHPEKVDPSVRDLLIKYQLEAKDVLAKHFYGKEEAVKPVQAMSLVDQMLMHAKAAVDHEQRLLALEENARLLNEHRLEASRELLALPAPSSEVPEKSLRAQINERVRLYCIETSVPFGVAWGKLYREFRDLSKIDLVRRAKNRKLEPLRYAGDEGLLQGVYDLACKLFKV